MVKGIFACCNTKCSATKNVEHLVDLSSVNDYESLSDGEKIKCEFCNMQLKIMGEKNNTLGVFSSLSLSDKRIELKRRADEHHKTHIAPLKEHLLHITKYGDG